MIVTSLGYQEDLGGSVSRSRPVLECIFSTHTLIITESGTNLSGKQAYPALYPVGPVGESVSIRVQKSGLPIWTRNTKWVNTRAILHDVVPGTGLAKSKRLLEGIISDEPSESNGILEFVVEPARENIVLDPSEIVELVTYPDASEEAIGQSIPSVSGVVTGELLRVSAPAYTTLTAHLYPGDTSAKVKSVSDLGSSGTLNIDEASYTFTSASGDEVFGLDVTGFHQSGTTVSVQGSAIFLACQPNATALSNPTSEGEALSGGAVDLVTSTITWPSLPVVPAAQARQNILLQFDQVDSGIDTATDSINATQTITATDSNVAPDTLLPHAVVLASPDLSQEGKLYFPDPSQDKIVLGIYNLTLNVAAPGVVKADVKVGGRTVWAMRNGSVIHSQTSLSINFDIDTNILPILITRDIDGADITLTIAAATRTISLGNLDQAAYAAVKSNEIFAVKQTTVNPNRGEDLEGFAAFEWFSADTYAGDAEAYIDGVRLGKLVANNIAGSTLNQTIAVDIQSPGNANLQDSDISAIVSGGTTSLGNAYAAVHQTISPSYEPSGSAGGLTRYAARIKFKPPKGAITGSGGANHIATAYYSDGLFTSGGGTIQDSYHAESFTPSANGQYSVALHPSSDTADFEFYHEIIDGLFGSYIHAVTVQSVKIEWTIDPVYANNTPASGFSQVNNNNLPIQNQVIVAANGVINFPVAAPPRTVITQFALPQAVSWDWFTGKTVEIRRPAGAEPDLHIVRAVLPVNFNPVIYEPAESIVADITARSGNPADIVKFYVEMLGDSVVAGDYDSSKSWFSAEGWIFARRQTESMEAAELLRRVKEQALLQLSETPHGVRMVRRLSKAGRWNRVDEGEVPEDDPALLSWTPRLSRYNHVTLRYDEGRKVLQATSANNLHCQLSVAELNGEVRPIEIDAGWLGNDEATATAFLADYCKLYAPLRQIVSMRLPHTHYRLEEGDIIGYLRVLYRITELTNTDGTISLTAEEIP